jgi:hypothetical protein
MTFVTTGNQYQHPGTEVFVFEKRICPNAGRTIGCYTCYLSEEYHNVKYHAWCLGGSDHKDVFRQLSIVLNPESLREKAAEIEAGLDSKIWPEGNYRPQDLRWLAEELENCT